MRDPASMAQFLTLVEFEYNGTRTSLRAIKKQIHDNNVQISGSDRFANKVTQAIQMKD